MCSSEPSSVHYSSVVPILGFAYTSDTQYYRQPKHLYQIPIPIFAIGVVPSPGYTFWSHKMSISVPMVH